LRRGAGRQRNAVEPRHTTETIGGAGCEVIQAANADEAIAILKARPDIQVVFTDIQMPGSMDGLKLARFVRDNWPPIKIVATSAGDWSAMTICRMAACSCRSRIAAARWSQRCAR
jgi:CheY-like chemotaxis protein